MEVIEMISSFINSTGFPVVCCFFLWAYIQNTMKDITKALDNNTAVIQNLIEKINAL